MPNCQIIDPLVTPYIDGQLTDTDRRIVDEHLRLCPPCHSRVAAERAVHDLLAQRREALAGCCAPESLRSRCREAARREGREQREALGVPGQSGRGQIVPAWRTRLAPLALAASLVLIVGIAFLYQLTASSSRVLAAELAADHMKCFAINNVLRPRADAAAVASSMLSGFGWRVALPAVAADSGLELVGSRPCLYGEGKIAHIMYRHNGEAVSLFMLPRESRTQEIVDVLGHRAAIWCDGDRTFVLLAREPKQEVERLASVVRQTMR
jgi:anti-sigma factor RsiW